MLEVAIPGRGDFRLSHLVLDVNGTLACDGVLLPGVAEAIAQLRPFLTVHLLSADTYGALDDIAGQLGIAGKRLTPGLPEAEQKAAYIRQLGAASTAAIGNGVNDGGMLLEAAIGVAVLGPEGLSVEALRTADIVASSVLSALDLFLYPKRLAATLRR